MVLVFPPIAYAVTNRPLHGAVSDRSHWGLSKILDEPCTPSVNTFAVTDSDGVQPAFVGIHVKLEVTVHSGGKPLVAVLTLRS